MEYTWGLSRTGSKGLSKLVVVELQRQEAGESLECQTASWQLFWGYDLQRRTPGDTL